MLLVDSAPSVLEPPDLHLSLSPRCPSVFFLLSFRVVCSAAEFCSHPMSWLCLSVIESFSAWLQRPFIYSSENPMISLGRDASCRDTYIVLLPIPREWRILAIPLSGVLYKQHPWYHWVPQSFPLTVTTSHAHGVFLVAQQWRICLQCGRPSFSPWVGKIPWRREWLPVPVFLPGGFHGQRSLAGYCPWGRKESETNEPLSFSAHGSHRVRNPHGCGKN